MDPSLAGLLSQDRVVAATQIVRDISNNFMRHCRPSQTKIEDIIPGNLILPWLSPLWNATSKYYEDPTQPVYKQSATTKALQGTGCFRARQLAFAKISPISLVPAALLSGQPDTSPRLSTIAVEQSDC
jgi:hypothetical protein